MRINLHVISLLQAIATIIAVAPVFASDGQLEINQACAVNTGCFPGDAPGFPVTITTPGSYRLTGNLDLSAVDINLSGIEVGAPAVTVDLGGFHIAGATTCSGSGASISCSPSSTGGGSAGVHFMSNATAGVVQNGIVRNMTNFGVRTQATGLRVHDITAIHNGADGINGTNGTFIVNSVAIRNGRDGIAINFGSVVDGVIASGNGRHGILGRGASVVARTAARENARRGFSLAALSKFGKNNLSQSNAETDSCGGGICTDRTRFYLTREGHQGDAVLTACTLGFHTASHTELQSLAPYAYDYILGATKGDSGSGVPVNSVGWARSGDSENTGTGLPVNCSGWTSTSGNKSGTSIAIRGIINFSLSDPAAINPSHTFETRFGACLNTSSVWCVEGGSPD